MASLREAQFRHAQHYESILRSANNRYLEGGHTLTEGISVFDREWANVQTAYAWTEKWGTADSDAASVCTAINDGGSHLLDLRQHPIERIDCNKRFGQGQPNEVP